MKDLDFDELDKAVSAVLTPAAQAAKPPEMETVEAPAAPASQPTDAPEAGPTPKTASQSLIPPRRGQFMDVVRPAPKAETALPVTSSAGKTIQPLTVSPVPAEEPKPDQAAEPHKTDIALEAPAEPADAAKLQPDRPALDTSQSDAKEELAWPDPLEVHGFQDTDRAKEQPDAGQPAESGDNQPDHPNTEAAEPSVSSGPSNESLFLKDAKVEKRPLGAFSAAEETKEALPPPASSEETTAVQDDQPAEAGSRSRDEMPTPLPPELDKDILTIESELRVFNPEDQLSEHRRAEDGGEATGQAASIHPQYREKPADGQQPVRPLFDVADYHPALPATAGGHNTRHVILWAAAALLLLAATAAGFAYWFYKGL